MLIDEILVILYILILILIIIKVLIKIRCRPIIIGGNHDKEKYAFVTVMFGGDKYLQGVLTLAYSLQKVKTKHDIVCMVTDDVSESAKNKMKDLNIKVVNVPYLKYKTKKLKTRRQQELYSSWIDVSYTKWNCLSLTEYTKVLFLDADMLVVTNVDDIFNKHAPASVFWPRPGVKNIYLTDKISKETIELGLNHGMVGDGGCTLLPTGKKYYTDFKNMLNDLQPFGFTNCFSGHDEQSIAYFMSVYDKGPKYDWFNLNKKYSCSWAIKCDLNTGYILNYIGETKPWLDDLRDKWPDTKKWYELNDEMKKKYP